jgi:hypothetical protein
MTLIVLLLSIQLLWAEESFWKEDLIKAAFPNSQCKTIKNKCHTKLCVTNTNHFSQPMAVILPQEPAQIFRIHFLGHTSNNGKPISQNGYYDHDLTTAVLNFDFSNRACGKKSNEVIVIPWSQGKCENYDREIINAKDFLRHFDTLIDIFNLPLHLSAHSGGGRVLSRILETKSDLNFKIKNLTLYDGIYSQKEALRFSKWILENPDVHFRNVTLINGIPDQLTQKYLPLKKLEWTRLSPIESDHWDLVRRY